jgi:ectoine hydroxylase-related dioxygenase (phytanoyl-CoA dioxygenase family)
MLSAAQIAAFAAEGYLAPLPALDPGETAACRRAVEAFILREGGAAAGLPRGALRTKAHLRCPALLELARRPAILDAVADLLGPDLLCRSVSIFLKEPGDPAHIAWHQDAAYWGLEPPDLATAWVALTDSTAENGALAVLPGSHRAPLMPHGPSGDPANFLSNGQTITAPIDPAAVRFLSLRAGEMSLHHVGTAHGSGPNRSAARRIGVAIRYMAPHVRNLPGRRDSALLVRGVDRYRHFDPEPALAPGSPA